MIKIVVYDQIYKEEAEGIEKIHNKELMKKCVRNI